MGLTKLTGEIPRRTMVLMFIIDVSGSMWGTRIGKVNTSIEELLPKIQELSDGNPDAEVKVAVMTFSDEAKWITPEPVSAGEYRWNYLEAEGMTNFADACEKLNQKLSRTGFMKEASSSFAPVIFLMSDGDPNDEDYKEKIVELKKNSWFVNATKIGLAIDDEANEEVLSEFTCNPRTVVHSNGPDELKKWITFLAIRSSQIGSRSRQAGERSREEEMAHEIEIFDPTMSEDDLMAYLDPDDPGIIIPDPETAPSEADIDDDGILW